jgi:autotransporter-associated beta strand protein
MKPHFHQLLAFAALLSPAAGQIFVEKVFQVNQSIPDYGQYVDVRTLSDFGMSSILDVNAGIALQGAAGSSMRLGDYFVSLTYGTASENERVAVLLNRPGATAARPWGSSLGSANLKFDDSVAAPNAFGVNTVSGTYAADGRLGVNPYASPSAFNPQTVTHGLAALNGDLLASNTWSLLVADAGQGGAAVLSSWRLLVTGTAAESGTLDPGPGGSIGDGGSSAGQEIKAGLQVSGSGANSVTARISGNLVLSGGLAGAGNLVKTGAGELTLSGNSSAFTGSVELSQGSLRILGNQALGPGAGIRVSGNGSTLNLAGEALLNAPISLEGAGTELLLEGGGTLAGPLTGEGALRKVGGGFTSLTGASTIGGGVVVEAGVLSVNGSISGGGVLSVSAAATLMGSGSINVSTSISGTHSAGNSPGIQTFADDLSYAGGSRIVWELVANTLADRGSSHDAIDVTGDLSIAGPTSLELSFDSLSGSAVDWENGFWNADIVGTDGWRIFGVLGAVSGIENLVLGPASGWIDSGGRSLATARPEAGFSLHLGEDGVYLNYQAAPVPEPSTLLCCAMFLMGGAMRRRRKP